MLSSPQIAVSAVQHRKFRRAAGQLSAAPGSGSLGRSVARSPVRLSEEPESSRWDAEWCAWSPTLRIWWRRQRRFVSCQFVINATSACVMAMTNDITPILLRGGAGRKQQYARMVTPSTHNFFFVNLVRALMKRTGARPPATTPSQPPTTLPFVPSRSHFSALQPPTTIKMIYSMNSGLFQQFLKNR